MTIRKLDAAHLRELLIKPDNIFDFIDDEVPADQELDLDKAWHGLHFMLTGTNWDGEEPLSYLLEGGHVISNAEEHDVGYGPARGLTTIEVKQFSDALNEITQTEFQARYDSVQMDALEIYPTGWNQEADPQGMIDWMKTSFTQLKEFVRSAAVEHTCLILYL